jgi:Clp amino terminal domain, pathogenicity island component/UvrB/uvrC motif
MNREFGTARRAEEAARAMFERFTDQARRVVVLAQEEARLLRHDYIGTEHILLGLVHDQDTMPARTLAALGVTAERARQQVEQVSGPGHASRTGHIPFTPMAKVTLQRALREALQLGSGSIGPEHILLGLVRGGEGPANEVLVGLGVEVAEVRPQVLEQMHVRPADPAGRPGPAGGRSRLGGRKLKSELRARFDAIEARLSALESRVGTGPDVRDLDDQIALVRREKEAAIDAEEFENAAVLRDREKQLLADWSDRQRDWYASHRDLPSLSDEVDQMRDLLRRHGIEPRDGAA